MFMIKLNNMPLYFKKEKGKLVASFVDPVVFPNRKKAKRVLRRLNKFHGGNWVLVKFS